MKLSKGGTFDEAAAVAKTNTVAAERTLENEKMRVTKCKEEAKAAVEAVAKKHLLGEEAVEWCSAMVAKKLLAGGAAKEAAKEAVCEWLIKPEMAVVEKMAAADGQMGCLMKLYREWRLSGDDDFLRALWPKARKAWARIFACGRRGCIRATPMSMAVL